MDILEIDNSRFRDYWQIFIKNYSVSPFYSLSYIEFLHSISEPPVNNESFLVLDNNHPVAICPIIIENGDFGKQISAKNGFIPYHLIAHDLTQKSRKKVLQVINDRLADLTKQFDLSVLKSFIDPLSYIDHHKIYHNQLLKEKYLDMTSLTQILDLTIGIDKIWSGVRKSYRSLINNAKRTHTIEIFDAVNKDREQFFRFGELYHRAADQKVYSQQSWDSLFRMLENELAFLVVIRDNVKLLGASFYIVQNSRVYYALGCNAPEINPKLSIGHISLWSAIDYCCQKYYSYFELGWQDISTQLLYQPTLKEKHIAKFKHGFGGNNVPLYRGMKFLKSDDCKTFVNHNVHKFLNEMETQFNEE